MPDGVCVGDTSTGPGDPRLLTGKGRALRTSTGKNASTARNPRFLETPTWMESH